MKTLIEFLVANKDLIGAALLAISELLAVLFPSSTGFGGIIAGVVKLLKKALNKPVE